MRKAPACHIHRTSPFGPSSSSLIFNATRAPAIANSGSLDQGEGTLYLRYTRCQGRLGKTRADCARLDSHAALI
jgi:hypothetical protein